MDYYTDLFSVDSYDPMPTLVELEEQWEYELECMIEDVEYREGLDEVATKELVGMTVDELPF